MILTGTMISTVRCEPDKTSYWGANRACQHDPVRCTSTMNCAQHGTMLARSRYFLPFFRPMLERCSSCSGRRRCDPGAIEIIVLGTSSGPSDRCWHGAMPARCDAGAMNLAKVCMPTIGISSYNNRNKTCQWQCKCTGHCFH